MSALGRPLVLGAVAVLLAATAPSTSAGSTASRAHVFRVTGPGTGAVELYLTADTDDGVLFVARLGRGPRRTLRWSHVRELGGRTAPRAYAAGAAADPCAVPVCAVTQYEAELVHFGIHDRLATGETIEIGVIADDVEVHTKGSWRARRLGSSRFVRRTGADADASGVAAGDASYEVFRSATAGGGAIGSIAFGALPCDVEGTGTARLTGGVATRTLHCDRADMRTAVVLAQGRTQWSLSGDVRGRYATRSRLLVLAL